MENNIIDVKGNKVSVIKIGNEDYISLTDLARYADADEADILNVALFGMTAKEWKKYNKNLKGNIRDYTDLLHLIILNNLENINSELIKEGLNQKDRLIKLNLKNNTSIDELSLLETNQTKV